jgi:PAS domain S-box-containing protein
MSRIPTDRASTIVAAALVCIGYFVGARVGFAFTIHPSPVSTLWPPNSILLAALLLMPPRAWAIMLLAAFPAHLAIQLANDIPLTMILLWFVSNCSQALIGAICVRRLTGGSMRFDNSRHVGAFVLGSIVGVFLSCFLDAGFVELVGGWGEGPFWQIWRSRFFSNVLAELTVAPAIVAWSQIDAQSLRRVSARSLAEAVGLGVGLVGVSVLVFMWRESGLGGIQALLYAPVPFLVWAAVRFGSIGTSTATMTVALLATRGAMNRVGPFLTSAPADSALSIQLCLIFTSIPLLLLSAVMRERQRAERAAVFNEESLKLALDAAQMTIWDWSLPPGDATRRRESSSAPFGALLRVVHPDDQPAVAEAITAAIEKGSPWDVEFRVVHPDGNVRWVMGKGEVLRDEAGQPTRLLGVNVDITDRKRADEAVRASEELFARAFRSSPDAMVISRRADGQIIDVNDRWEALFGHARAAAVGRTMAELPLAAGPGDQATLRRLIEAPGPVRDVEAQFVTRSGERRETIIATETVEMGGHACFITTIRDITERQRAQREAQEQRQLLTHLGRVAVLGELSGALAHELSQPLTAILSNAQAARRMLARQPVDLREIDEILEDIASADRRAGEVIRRLRAMFKRGESNRQLLDLNEITRDVLDFARSDLLTRHVQVTTRLASDLPKVRGDSVQVQQVLLNLIVNGCEAMIGNEPNDRSLVIETSVVDHDTVGISVLDNGSGIRADILDQLFEPFVTTKHQGLGLGLTICRSIATAHGGQLWAGNNAGRGSAFRLMLPRNDDFTPSV